MSKDPKGNGGNIDELFTRFDNVFFEKTRLSMLTLLFREEKLSFLGLKNRLSLSDGALYTHLEKLITAGYARKRKEVAGMTVQTVYSPTPQGRREFMEYLDFVQNLILEEAAGNNGGRNGFGTGKDQNGKNKMIGTKKQEEIDKGG